MFADHASTPPRPPSYRAVIRAPHVMRSFAPSLLGRLSLATSGLALVLLLEQNTGSFAVAGAVTAVLAVATVVSTPWRARLIDRRGQTAVMLGLGLAHAVTLVTLGLVADAGLPTLLGVGALAGATSPPFGATMRVLWSAALPPGGFRKRAFSLDAVAEELTFAAGPLLAALLVALGSPFGALLASAGCVAVGAVGFVTSPLSLARRSSTHRQLGEPSKPDTSKPDTSNPDTSTRSDDTGAASGSTLRPATPLRSRGFVPVVVAMTVPGVILGAIEIAAPAIAAAESSTLLSGVLLAAFAGASALGGLVHGRVRVHASVGRQLVVGSLVLVAVVGASGLVGGGLAALIGFALSGLCLAPLLIVGYLAADALTDPRVGTEAGSWINTAVNLGAAFGAVVFGALTDATTAGVALALTACAAAVITAACAPFLRSRVA